jgi:hypothetical protein
VTLLRGLLALPLVLALAACGSSAPTGPGIPEQHWKNLLVQVESRPPVPQGRSEFLVILTDERNHPAWNCLVSLRSSPQEPWVQAIQDGRVAVYRRALVIDENHSRLQVQIERGAERGYLEFSLPSKVSTTLAK